jgi:DNA-binding NarL/FixJ family response regulator
LGRPRALADASHTPAIALPASPAEFKALPVSLSKRECEVLKLLAERYSDPEIAATLFIAPRTASNHVTSLFNKLCVANRRDAAAIAARHGLLSSIRD